MNKRGLITMVCLVAIAAGVLVAHTAQATALTAERNTQQRSGKTVNLGMKADSKIFAGAMVAVDGSGYATNAASVSGAQVVGRAHRTVSNVDGTNNQKRIDVDVGIFGWVNFGGVTAGNIGDICYVVDNQTVSVTNTGANTIIAGVILDVDVPNSIVWVDTGERDKTAGGFTTLSVSGAATVGSTLTVTGATTLASTLAVTGASTFTGAGLFSTTLGADGNTIIGGTLTGSNTVRATGYLVGAQVGKSFAITNQSTFFTNVVQYNGGVVTGSIYISAGTTTQR